MNQRFDPPKLTAILVNIGTEICGPLDGLRESLVRLIEESEFDFSPKQQAHASTMIGLCDELSRLTRETLGAGDSGGS